MVGCRAGWRWPCAMPFLECGIRLKNPGPELVLILLNPPNGADWRSLTDSDVSEDVLFLTMFMVATNESISAPCQSLCWQSRSEQWALVSASCPRVESRSPCHRPSPPLRVEGMFPRPRYCSKEHEAHCVRAATWLLGCPRRPFVNDFQGAPARPASCVVVSMLDKIDKRVQLYLGSPIFVLLVVRFLAAFCCAGEAGAGAFVVCCAQALSSREALCSKNAVVSDLRNLCEKTRHQPNEWNCALRFFFERRNRASVASALDRSVHCRRECPRARPQWKVLTAASLRKPLSSDELSCRSVSLSTGTTPLSAQALLVSSVKRQCSVCVRRVPKQRCGVECCPCETLESSSMLGRSHLL